MKFKVCFDVSYDITTSKEFAEVLNEETFRNLTGGVMALYCTENKCAIYGSPNTSVKDNKLYIFDEVVVDFTKEEIFDI